MSIYYQDEQAVLHHGDCLEVMADMPAESIDAIVTDPPYGLGFMGRTWDALPPGKEWAEACLRVLKPGGHLLAFGGSRTWHRLAVAIEDGGFEIRDSIMWVHGSGFPKSGDISKAIDRAAGAEREVVGMSPHFSPGRSVDNFGVGGGMTGQRDRSITAPATEDAKRWGGWGTQLKPSFEPIVVARKPMPGTVTANVLEHGTGALNIDGCRVAATDKTTFPAGAVSDTEQVYGSGEGMYGMRPRPADSNPSGRFPANVVFDESQAAALDQQSGHQKDGFHVGRNRDASQDMGGYSGAWKKDSRDGGYGGGGGASRFFYVAKAARHERPNVNGITHPTVKPLALMQWLVRLVTPPGGTVLDPFAGSGTTMEAAITEGFNPIGIDITDEYLPLIEHRLQKPHQVAFNFNTSEAT